MKSELVCVIGGGFAGLSAATALAAAGVPVQLFEARRGLGGRATAFRDPKTGDRIDNGQHVLAGCYTETLAFLRRIGSLGLLHWPSTLTVPMIEESGRRTELRLPPLPAPLDLIGAAFAWDALTPAERWSILRVGRALRGRSTVHPDDTVRQWLQRHGQSASICRLLWEPLALAALNQSIDRAAATSFVAVASRMFGSAPHAATLLLPAVPLDELYALPARHYLERAGCRVTTGAKARVVFDGDRIDAVRVGNDITPAGIVISSVPWFALGDVLHSPPNVLTPIVANAAAMQSAPIVTVNLWFSDAAIDDRFIGLPGRTFQWVFNRSRITGSCDGHLSLVSSGADALNGVPNNELVAIARRELSEAIPPVREAQLRHAQVVRERRATFSLQPGGPRRPATSTPVRGLLLAGDWIDTGLPATIESAVESGHRAAARALECLQ